MPETILNKEEEENDCARRCNYTPPRTLLLFWFSRPTTFFFSFFYFFLLYEIVRFCSISTANQESTHTIPSLRSSSQWVGGWMNGCDEGKGEIPKANTCSSSSSSVIQRGLWYLKVLFAAADWATWNTKDWKWFDLELLLLLLLLDIERFYCGGGLNFRLSFRRRNGRTDGRTGNWFRSDLICEHRGYHSAQLRDNDVTTTWQQKQK